ncbi:MYXO-CTERM sorting domain-containing protein [Myxococcus xanthus]|uniref:MYXO-CTERM sorting domain-containing protein n=1 Tax=Myxococcus xanthus TaxID=34 RepID=UPI003454E395
MGGEPDGGVDAGPGGDPDGGVDAGVPGEPPPPRDEGGCSSAPDGLTWALLLLLAAAFIRR